MLGSAIGLKKHVQKRKLVLVFKLLRTYWGQVYQVYVQAAFGTKEMTLCETASKSVWGRIPREVMFELTHKGCAGERHVEKRLIWQQYGKWIGIWMEWRQGNHLVYGSSPGMR